METTEADPRGESSLGVNHPKEWIILGVDNPRGWIFFWGV